ncbi:MAG: hypothetical protein WB763_20485 [Terriglobia bacterium]
MVLSEVKRLASARSCNFSRDLFVFQYLQCATSGAPYPKPPLKSQLLQVRDRSLVTYPAQCDDGRLLNVGIRI